MKDLDEMGIIRIGAEVQDGDLLVGKVTPKGLQNYLQKNVYYTQSSGKAREVRDTSLRVPHGGGGIVHDVKIFTREAGDELSPGVNMLVRVYIVQNVKFTKEIKWRDVTEIKGLFPVLCRKKICHSYLTEHLLISC